MKKNTFLMLASMALAAFGLIYFNGCSQKNNVEPPQTSIKSSNNSNPFSPSDYRSAVAIRDSIDNYFTNERRAHSIFRKIWNWIVAHVGTYIGNLNCGGNSNCGPCPGICIGTGIYAPSRPIDSLQATTFTQNNDSGVIAVHAISSTSMIVRFQDSADFVKDDTFFVPQNINLTPKVADSLGVPYITILKGVYPMVTGTDGNRETLVNINL
jgi:hypothetical protein